MKNWISLLCMLMTFHLAGQNNYIYNGGASQGFDFSTAYKATNNNIFSGSSEDGFDNAMNISDGKKWFGGEGDGWGNGINNTTKNGVYLGGENDGMAYAVYHQKSNNGIALGGDDDGFSFYTSTNNISEIAYDGGEGDGFSASGISKLIWDGDISKDWLMADNWNIPIVPTMNHAVCIPSGVPRFPKLSNILGISIFEEHTYASSSVTIMNNAVINGIEGVKVVVNGKLTVIGDLFINSSEGPQIEGRKNGLIEIKTGGEIRVNE